jgi:serine protease Do
VNFDRRNDKLLTVVNVGVREMEDAGVEARKAWLPVKLQAITRDMAAALGTNSLTGVRVTQVYPNSTASAAGLQVGDLIVLLDGERIPAQQDGDEEVFTNRIRQYRVGARPELTVMRGKETLKLAVELDRSPPPERELGKYEDVNFEFSVRELNIHDRVARDLDEAFEGVLVTVVAEGSWAALGGLFVGDLIVRVEGNTIKDAASLEAQMKKVAEAKPKFVEMLVRRGTRTRYVELEPVWSNHVAAP